MADYSHILFNKSPMQLRLLGARGGRAFGRNQRARRALSPPPPEVLPLAPVVRETTPEAIAVLDSQFPWLRRAEMRHSSGKPDSTPGKTVNEAQPLLVPKLLGGRDIPNSRSFGSGAEKSAGNQDESKVPDCILSQVVAGR